MRRTSTDPPRASRRPEVRPLASALRARFLLLLPLCVAVLAFAWTADADTPYPVVTMTEAGPDSHLDFNTSFYLSGEVDKDTDRVQAMVVRKGNPVIGGSVGPPCYQVRKEVQEFMKDGLQPGIQTVKGATSRSYTILVTEAWMAPPVAKPDAGADDAGPPKTGGVTATITANINIIGDTPTTTPDGGARDAGAGDAGAPDGHVVVTNGPAAPADTPKPVTFKLFVPKSDEFFHPGMSFCLLVFQHKKLREDLIAPLVTAYVKACDDLGTQRKTDEVGGNPLRAVCTLPSPGSEFENRIRNLVRERQQSGGVRQTPGEDAVVKSTEDALAKSYGEIRALTTSAAKVRDVLRNWKPTVTDPAKLVLFSEAVASEPKPKPKPAAEPPKVKKVLLQLVALKDKRDPAGAAKVLDVWFLDRENVVVARDRPVAVKGSPKGLEIVATSALRLSDTNFTLRDLVNLVNGQLHLGNSDVEAAKLNEELEPIMSSLVQYSSQQKDTLHARPDQLRALGAAVRRILAIKDDSYTQTELEIKEPLAEWLRPALSQDPSAQLSKVADELERLEANHEKFLAKLAEGTTEITSAIEASMSQTMPASVPVAADRQFDQHIWASSYLTPVVGGVLVLPPHSDAIIAPYVAVQLHFVPNLIDDPMWSHGNYDWTRFAAIELGVATNSGSFGTDSRFRGLGTFPPIFMGLAIHPIPYTSFTGGISVFDVRSSTVPQQSYQATALPFLAVNVQANIPDLVRFAVHRNTVTTNIGTE